MVVLKSPRENVEHKKDERERETTDKWRTSLRNESLQTIFDQKKKNIPFLESITILQSLLVTLIASQL